MIDGLPGFGPVIDDGAADRLWLMLGQRFRFYPKQGFFRTVIDDTARLNSFHPVRDYLDTLKWDGVPRIDKWLTTYGGAASSPYVDAVGALMLIAAVRRVRQPGCKFDEAVVLESPQGTNKSSALRVMAVKEEWFSDNLPLYAKGKEVIELLAGHWIMEAGELSGMKRADIEHLKAFFSRQVDEARMAYGHYPIRAPRQGIIVGTTNDEEYLRDLTGNRRIWPIRVKRFDIEALARDRDQIWAEAATREAAGASIRLDPALYKDAARQQAARTTEDPFYESLHAALEGQKGKITSEQVWDILGVPTHLRGQDQAKRVTSAMRRLGWKRPKNRLIKDGKKAVVGFTKGPQPWTLVKAKARM